MSVKAQNAAEMANAHAPQVLKIVVAVVSIQNTTPNTAANVAMLVKVATFATWGAVSSNVQNMHPHLALVVVLTPIPTPITVVVAVTSAAVKSAVSAPSAFVPAIS